MSSSLKSFFNFPDPLDPNIPNFPLLGSHWPITLICGGYVLFVLKLGKIFMEHRKPYDLKKIIIAYNIFQMIYNSVIVVLGIYYFILFPAYDNRCIVQLPLDHPNKNMERYLTYGYFINKVIDLLETIFFVLRKSYKQITVLHVFHHLMMSYPMYWGIQYYGFGGQYTSMGFLNSFVHAVMYFYYLISIINPKLKGNLWWKKYITKLQLIQFIMLLFQSLYILAFNPTCQFPLFLQYLQVLLSVTMILMFSNFYYQAYIKPKPHKLQKEQ